jgi:hypothetical protein
MCDESNAAPLPPHGRSNPGAPAKLHRCHIDEVLDEVLEETFPASDATAITTDR